jgi:hypothetical protein
VVVRHSAEACRLCIRGRQPASEVRDDGHGVDLLEHGEMPTRESASADHGYA